MRQHSSAASAVIGMHAQCAVGVAADYMGGACGCLTKSRCCRHVHLFALSTESASRANCPHGHTQPAESAVTTGQSRRALEVGKCARRATNEQQDRYGQGLCENCNLHSTLLLHGLAWRA